MKIIQMLSIEVENFKEYSNLIKILIFVTTDELSAPH